MVFLSNINVSPNLEAVVDLQMFNGPLLSAGSPLIDDVEESYACVEE